MTEEEKPSIAHQPLFAGYVQHSFQNPESVSARSFFKKLFLKSSLYLLEHFWQSLQQKHRHRCFLLNSEKISKAHFSYNTSERLLL